MNKSFLDSLLAHQEVVVSGEVAGVLGAHQLQHELNAGTLLLLEPTHADDELLARTVVIPEVGGGKGI